jgi:2-dehydrotetronate isomerase
MKISANLGFLWKNLPLLERFEQASQAGFRYVELHETEGVSPIDIENTLKRLKITLTGLNAAMKEGGLGAKKGREREFQKEIDKAIEISLSTGAKNIHALAGNVDSIYKMQATGVLVDNLQEAADKAKAHGLTILLEALNPVDRPSYFYGTLQEVSTIIMRVGRENVKIMADIYHIGVSEGDILRKLERYWPQIGHVQAASVPFRRELNEGEVNYKVIIEKLHSLELKTPLGLEYLPKGDVKQGLIFMQEMGLEF